MNAHDIFSKDLRRLEVAVLRAARLAGTREALTKQLSVLTEKVSLAKGRLALSDEMAGVLEAMQTRANGRAVGSFERLLTAVLQDVLPDAGDIVLQLSSSNNAPSLDILVNKAGNLESVLEGSGGAVTNVVSAGLRYAALTRTNNRRLMVLDEPDGWIRPARIPNFIQVLVEVSEQTQTQTLLVSHHDPAYFRNRANVLELRMAADSETIVAHPVLPQISEWADNQQPGIRSIRLVNFRSHTDTVLPLFPGVNALIGDNNLGKSNAICASIKAVAYNASDDSVIRHGAKFAQVELHIEAGKVITWTRHAKSSPKVTYALAQNGKPVHEGKAPGRGSVPDWVTRELGISMVDDLDVQIGAQKNPIFLLDSPASKRAQLLTVGRESGYLKQVMDAWGTIKRADRDVVREGESQISALSGAVLKTESVQSLVEALAEAGRGVKSLPGLFEQQQRLKATLNLLSRAARLKDAHGPSKALDSVLLTLRSPDLKNQSSLNRLLPLIGQNQRLAATVSVKPAPTLADIQDCKELLRAINQIRKLTPVAALPSLASKLVPALPDLKDVASIRAVGSRLREIRDAQALALRALQDTEADAVAAQTELNRLQAEIGVCPFCDKHFEGVDHAHSH